MATNELIPFKASHPGSLIYDELEARDIKQRDFAMEIGMNPTMLNEIIKGKRPVTADLALLLEKSLGIDAEYWLRYQMQFELNTARLKERNVRKLQLIDQWNLIKENVPYLIFKKLGVFVGDAERDIQTALAVYSVRDLQEIPALLVAQREKAYYRKSEKLQVNEVNLLGWSKLAVWEASKKKVPAFDKEKLPELKEQLRSVFCENCNTLENTRKMLNQYGIKMIHLQKFDKTPVDGYSFVSNGNPAIAFTLRHKRIDNFAFTIMHELGHVENHLDDENNSFIDFFGAEKAKNQKEDEADLYAQQTLISPSEWADLVTNYNPFDDLKIKRFSKKHGINPAIVLGRVCHELDYYAVSTSIDKTLN